MSDGALTSLIQIKRCCSSAAPAQQLTSQIRSIIEYLVIVL